MAQEPNPSSRTNASFPLWIIVLLAAAVIAGAGIWWTRPTPTATTNTNAVAAPPSTSDVRFSRKEGPDVVAIDSVYGYELRLPASWYYRAYALPLTQTATDGVLTLTTQSAPFDLELHPKPGEVLVGVHVYTASASLSEWYDGFVGANPRDVYQSVSVSRGTDRLTETITTGASPKRPLDTEWLDGTMISTFFLLNGHVVQAEAIIQGSSPTLTADATTILASLAPTGASSAEHTDPQSRYKFSAPTAWNVSKLADEKAGFELAPPGDSSTRVFVNVASNPQNLSIEEVFTSFDDTSRLWFSKYAHRTDTINGLTAERFSPFKEAANLPTRIEVAIKGVGFVGLLSYQYQMDDATDVFNQIVDSFSFL